MLDRVTDRIERARRATVRATIVPFLVRCGIAISLTMALSVAWPAELLASRYLVLLLLVAAYPAVAPRGRGATLAILVVVSGWLADTTWYGERVALWRVLALAALLYIGHSLAALAAVLPYDAEVNLDVATLWLARTAGAVLISSVLIVVALGLTSELVGGPFLLATLAGLAGAVGATLLLSRLLRRA